MRILGGTRNTTDDDDGDDDDDNGHEQDEDAQLVAALTLSDGGSGQYQGDNNLEAQVLAARYLANLMEALPGVAHTVVYHSAIPVLHSKLVKILYIDLAEQTLSVCSSTHQLDPHLQIISQTLEKISEEFPSSIVCENGLATLLNYLNFFSIAVQRTALQVVAAMYPGTLPDDPQCMAYHLQLPWLSGPAPCLVPYRVCMPLRHSTHRGLANMTVMQNLAHWPNDHVCFLLTRPLSTLTL
jgi:E3 ubiquitin-protein ligase TRIP12